MPNGDGLSEHEFRDLDKALSSLDNQLEEFAISIGGECIRNYHGPGRRIAFVGCDSIQRAIMFSPKLYKSIVNETLGTKDFVKLECPEFLVGAGAWKDEAGKRRHWHRIIDIRPALPSPDELKVLLEQMYNLLNSIGDKDLTEVVL